MHRFQLVRTIIFLEALTRPGPGGLYLISFLLQPIAILIAVTFLFSMIAREVPFGGNIFIFLVTGLLPHFTAVRIALRVMKVMSGWRKAKKLPGASIADYIIAISLFDTLIFFFATMILLFGAHTVYEGLHPPQDFSTIVGTFIMLGLFGAGVGTISITIMRFFPLWELLFMATQRIMIFLSGAFYVVDYIPVIVRNVVVYNPVAHCSMMLRVGYYGERYPHMTMDVEYVLWWILGSLFLGLLLERLTRNMVVKKAERNQESMDDSW